MRRALIAISCLLIAAPAEAQTGASFAEQIEDRDQEQPAQPTLPPLQPGSVASSSIGQAGQRQTREQVIQNAEPMGRISGRIQNRIQSRLRNRIDRDYDPQAGAVSSLAAAEDQARNASRSHR